MARPAATYALARNAWVTVVDRECPFALAASGPFVARSCLSVLADVARMPFAPPVDPLDANYQRALRQSDFASSQALSTIVHARGCTSLLLYFLLYGVDAQSPSNLTKGP